MASEAGRISGGPSAWTTRAAINTPGIGRERADERSDAEQREAREQRAPASVPVREHASGDEQRREHEHVGVDDPLLLHRGRAEVGTQRGQRDRDQVRVRDAHDLRDDENGQQADHPGTRLRFR